MYESHHAATVQWGHAGTENVTVNDVGQGEPTGDGIGPLLRGLGIGVATATGARSATHGGLIAFHPSPSTPQPHGACGLHNIMSATLVSLNISF